MQRDRDFLGRLQKYRYTGVNKYEDDYYGDKVMTLSDFRQWVRQQQKRKEAMEAQTASSKGT
jgi:import inner membrane translocase subunit TIM23